MKFKEVQKSLYDLFKSSSGGLVLLQASAVLTLIYPILGILGDIPFIKAVAGVLGIFGAVWYLAYMVGLAASFAKNDMKIICAAFALRCIDNIISIIIYSFAIRTLLSTVLYIALYALAALAVFYMSNSSNN